MHTTSTGSMPGKFLSRYVLLALIIATVFLAAPISAAAKSASYAEFNVDLTVQDDGTYHVEETQIVDFVDGPFVQGHRSIPLARTEGVTNIAVYEVVNGNRVAYSEDSTPNANTFNVKTTSTEAEITWTFSTVSNAEKTFVVVYDMLGALRTYPDTNPPAQEVWFTPVGSGLTGQTPVKSSTYTIHLPTAATPSSIVLAVDGEQVTDLSDITSDNQTFAFTHGSFNSGDSWEIRLQTDIVAPNALVPAWQASDDAQRQKQLEQEQRDTQVAGFASLGGVALLVIGSLGILLLWYTRGKDPATGVVASFLPEPPDATPPAVVGVLIDEKADEHDIVSTIVDLGNRGVLVVHDQTGQLPSIELTDKQVALSPFEQQLVHALFPNADKSGTAVPYRTASYSIKANTDTLKAALYQEVVDRGYFNQSPEQTRGRWRGIATAITSVSILAAILASFLISPWLLIPAFAVTALSLILRQAARALPKRTEAGAEATAKWRAFERYLKDLDKYDSVDTAKANFDRYLPYAIAFGIEKTWVNRFESAQSANPSWLNPGDVITGVPGRSRGSGWHGPIIIGMGGNPNPGGGVGMPDVNLPDMKMPDLQDASDSAARGLTSASKGGVDLLNVLGGIISIASIFVGGGGGGGSSGGGDGGFN
jgi:uncharacterized membrane protein